MAESIDQLQIDINAQANRANKVIDTLCSKIDRLTVSMNHLDGSKLGVLANGVQRLGTAMQTMNNVKTADFTRLAKNLQTLNNLDVSKLSNLSVNVKHIATAFNGLSGMEESAKQMTALASGIKQLGYSSAEKAIKNIPLLATAMKKLMSELSTAPKVSQNLIDMTNALAKLARTGSSSGKAANSLVSSFNRISKASSGMKVGLLSAVNGISAIRRSILSALGVVGGFYAVIRGIKESINIASDLTEVQNVVDVTFGNYKKKIEDLAKVSIPELGMSELTTKQIASRYQAMGTAMGISQKGMADMSTELTRLAGDMASFYNVEQKAVGEDLEAIFTGQTKPLRQYGLDLTEATLQEWAMKQGIDANINSMSQMEKTMLRYQYVMANTGAAQGDFIRTADTWANQVRVLKENFKALGSVMGSTFINALKPLVKALNSAMSHIISFANVVSNALGKIFGWTYEENSGGIAQDYEDIADSAEDLATGTGKAAENAKKLKQQLQGFDELNVLTSDLADNLDSATGGTGGTGSGANSGYEGQWKKTGEVLPFESDIDTLRKLGKTISETLINAMEGIDWNGAYEKARNFGTGLAEFLNGLFEGYNGKTLFGEVGKTIASALNTVVYSALSFGETFDFKQFGYNIADGINNFFRTFDFGSLAQTLNVWVDGIKDAIKTIIKETDWGEVLNGLKDFFENLEIDTVGVIIGAVVLKKILKVSVAKSALLFVGNKISEKLVAAIAAKLGVEATWSSVFGGIGAAISGAIANAGGISGLLTLDMAALVGETGFATAGLLAGAAFIGGIIASIGGWNFGQWLNEKITGEKIELSFTDQFKDALSSFTDGSWQEALKLWRDDIAENLAQLTVDTQTKFDEIKINVSKKVSDIWTDVSGKWDSLRQDVSGANLLIKQDIDDMLTKTAGNIDYWYTNDIAPWFTKEKWKNLAENIPNAIKEKWNEFTSWWQNTAIVSWWNNNVAPWFTKEKWENVGQGIKDGITGIWSDFVSWWQGTAIGNWWNNNVAPWFSKEKWNFSGIKDGVSSAFQGAIEAIKQKWNSFANTLNSILKINIQPVIVSGKTIFSGGVLNLGVIPTFAQGGFPEDGWFRASQGEMLGKFDNGQSVVANNNQITDGISAAVQRGNQQMIGYMQEEIVELRKQNEFLMQIASKSFGITKEQIGENARSWAMEYTMRTGNEAYSF